MTHVTCRLTAKNRDQLRNPTLGNRVRASFTFFILSSVVSGRAGLWHTEHDIETVELLKQNDAELYFLPARRYPSAATSYRPVSVSVCISVSVSVTSRCFIETAEQTGLVFGTGASFDLSYTVL